MLSGTLSVWLGDGSCVGRRRVGRGAVGSCALLMAVVVGGGCKSSSGWVSYRSGVVYGPTVNCSTGLRLCTTTVLRSVGMCMSGGTTSIIISSGIIISTVIALVVGGLNLVILVVVVVVVGVVRLIRRFLRRMVGGVIGGDVAGFGWLG